MTAHLTIDGQPTDSDLLYSLQQQETRRQQRMIEKANLKYDQKLAKQQRKFLNKRKGKKK